MKKKIGALLLAVLMLLTLCTGCMDMELSLIHISEPTRPY